MVWVKGQSGNPSGKAKANPMLKRTITELAREIAPEALETLKQVMKSPKSTMTAKAIAADRILDRAYGKAPQAVGVVLAPARKASDLTDAELAAIIAGTVEQDDADVRLIEAVAIEDDHTSAGDGTGTTETE